MEDNFRKVVRLNRRLKKETTKNINDFNICNEEQKKTNRIR